MRYIQEEKRGDGHVEDAVVWVASLQFAQALQHAGEVLCGLILALFIEASGEELVHAARRAVAVVGVDVEAGLAVDDDLARPAVAGNPTACRAPARPRIPRAA